MCINVTGSSDNLTALKQALGEVAHLHLLVAVVRRMHTTWRDSSGSHHTGRTGQRRPRLLAVVHFLALEAHSVFGHMMAVAAVAAVVSSHCSLRYHVRRRRRRRHHHDDRHGHRYSFPSIFC